MHLFSLFLSRSLLLSPEFVTRIQGARSLESRGGNLHARERARKTICRTIPGAAAALPVYEKKVGEKKEARELVYSIV